MSLLLRTNSSASYVFVIKLASEDHVWLLIGPIEIHSGYNDGNNRRKSRERQNGLTVLVIKTPSIALLTQSITVSNHWCRCWSAKPGYRQRMPLLPWLAAALEQSTLISHFRSDTSSFPHPAEDLSFYQFFSIFTVSRCGSTASSSGQMTSCCNIIKYSLATYRPKCFAVEWACLIILLTDIVTTCPTHKNSCLTHVHRPTLIWQPKYCIDPNMLVVRRMQCKSLLSQLSARIQK